MKEIFSSAPLFLFLLLLLVLAVSAYLGESAILRKEGFMQFSSNTPLMGVISDDNYSVGNVKNNIIKLYDNMYFDPKNANLVEFGGSVMSGNTSASSASVSTVTVYDRDGGKHGPYDAIKGDDVPESSISNIAQTYSVFLKSSNLTDTKPLVLYAAWNADTFIHVFDLSTNLVPTSVLSTYFPTNSQVKTSYYAWNFASGKLSATNKMPLSDIGTSSISDSKNGTRIAINLYDPSKQPFQLCNQIYYDHTNGNLIFALDDGSISVYDRPFTANTTNPTPQNYTSKSPMTSSKSSINTTDYYTMVVSHPNNKFGVYYVANGGNTILVVLTNRNGNLKIENSYFYQADGSRIMTKGQIVPLDNDKNKNSTTTTFANAGTTTDASGTSGLPSQPNSLSDYYNWLAFWTTVAGAKDKDAVFKASNYIPKTSVIPPVCPSCSYCSGGNCGGGVCTNCGGQGGNGTSGGYSYADYLVKFGSGTKDLLEDAGSGATSLIRDTGKAGLGVLSVGAGLGVEAVKGGVGLAKETVGGTVGLAKEAVGGTVGLAKEAVGGTVGLAKEAGAGVAGIFKTNPMQISSSGQSDNYDRTGGAGGYVDKDGRGGPGTYTLPNAPLGQSGIDPYSYNGALVSKGGNYIPITTDFSAFGK